MYVSCSVARALFLHSDPCRARTTLPAASAVQEGAFLSGTLDQSPYATGSFHGSPLLIALFQPLLALGAGDNAAHAVFIAAQLVTAGLLEAICRAVAARSKPARAGKLEAFSSVSVGAVYLLNPFTVLACATHSLSALSHTVLAIAILAGVRGRPVSCGAAIAVAIHLDCHSVLLLVPALCLVDGRAPSFLCSFFVAFALALAVGIVQTGDAWYFGSQVDFALSGPDLAPTFGLYWYLFTQVCAGSRWPFMRLSTSLMYSRLVCVRGSLSADIRPLSRILPLSLLRAHTRLYRAALHRLSPSARFSGSCHVCRLGTAATIPDSGRFGVCGRTHRVLGASFRRTS
jgi:hypothetical protein